MASCGLRQGFQSARRTEIGSMRGARRAGAHATIREMRVSSNLMAAKIRGSTGLTPHRKETIGLEAAKEPITQARFQLKREAANP